jgi:Domain of unknown function (DUF1844)
MAEERGFEVVDKRRVSADAPTSEAEPEAKVGEAAAPEEEPAGTESGTANRSADAEAETGGADEEPTAESGPEGAMPEMDAVGVISMCVSMLHEVAWVKLGLVPSPLSQKIEKDLAQSRLAIDCVADLVRHLESCVDANTRRDLQNLISTLRMNFVQQSQR